MSLTKCRKTYLSLIIGLAGVAACADYEPTAPRTDAGAPSAKAARPVQLGRLQTLDDKFVEIAQQVPGFGGLAFDDAGNVQVYLTDLAKTAVARLVIAAFMLGRVKDSDVPPPRGRRFSGLCRVASISSS
ncbi:MAG: hypothetical protein ACREJ4_07000 [Candidatus Methylomirabilaceae bacterium]